MSKYHWHYMCLWSCFSEFHPSCCILCPIFYNFITVPRSISWQPLVTVDSLGNAYYCIQPWYKADFICEPHSLNDFPSHLALQDIQSFSYKIILRCLGSAPHRKERNKINTRIFLNKESETKIKGDSCIDYNTRRARTYLPPVLLAYDPIPHQESYMAAVIFVNNWIINYSNRKVTGESFINWCRIKTIKAAACNRQVNVLLKCHSFYVWQFNLLNFFIKEKREWKGNIAFSGMYYFTYFC